MRPGLILINETERLKKRVQYLKNFIVARREKLHSFENATLKKGRFNSFVTKIDGLWSSHTTDYGRQNKPFFNDIPNFWANWADRPNKFWGIWSIFS